MIEKCVYESIVKYTVDSILIAKPIYDSNNIVDDFEIIYVNESCIQKTGIKLSKNSLFSKIMTSISSAIDWIEVGRSAYQAAERTEQNFYSPHLDTWLQTVMQKLPEELLLVSVHDISKNKEHEQLLRRQNLRLASLSEELVLSRQNLKNKLDKIELLNTKLEHIAYFDTLTDLPNRTKMMSDLEHFIVTAHKKNTSLGIMLIDVDNLKNTNDSRGHSAGDELLKTVSNKLKLFLRDTIHIYRFGGDEFLVVVEQLASKDSIITVADTVLESINIENIQISAGISLYPEDSETLEELLKYADMAMYEVKKKGKNNIFFFQHLMQEKFLERLALETKLTNALNEDCFQLYFQPQVDIVYQKLRGFEALLRWKDPDLGWISPDQFIPLAEESHLIIPLGDWVLDTACAILTKWQHRYNFKGIMSVNVSPIQLRNPSFIYDLKATIKRHNIDPKTLEIEITEGIFIDNLEATVHILNEIKELGVGISLDDFGTGYSSLSYLQILPLTTLKIDKSFIANIASETSVEANITDAIISLVNKMGLDTIAEGVENKEQLSILQSINCRNTQGFLMGKPMPTDLCERMLSGDHTAILRNDEERIPYEI